VNYWTDQYTAAIRSGDVMKKHEADTKRTQAEQQMYAMIDNTEEQVV